MDKNTIVEIRLNSLNHIKKHLQEYHKLILKIEKDQKIRAKMMVNEGFELLEVANLIELITNIEDKNNENNVVL